MKKFAIAAAILLSGCATSPETLTHVEAEFTLSGNVSSEALSKCLVAKIEPHQTLFKMFDFEDASLPLQVRKLEKNTRLSQMQGAFALVALDINEIDSTHTETKLYVADGLAKGKIIKDYSKFVEDCYKGS